MTGSLVKTLRITFFHQCAMWIAHYNIIIFYSQQSLSVKTGTTLVSCSMWHAMRLKKRVPPWKSAHWHIPYTYAHALEEWLGCFKSQLCMTLIHNLIGSSDIFQVFRTSKVLQKRVNFFLCKTYAVIYEGRSIRFSIFCVTPVTWHPQTWPITTFTVSILNIKVQKLFGRLVFFCSLK